MKLPFQQRPTLRLSGSAHIPSHSFNYAVVLFSLWLGTSLVAIDTMIISVAIPKISSDFRALTDIGWYGSAYLLTLAATQPVFGTIFKLFDAKLVYLVSMIIFEGSVICAAAPISEVFIFGRALSGVGAGGLLQGAFAIITFTSPLEKRPLRLAIVISVFGLAACLAPVIGGILTDRVSWRWCFWINAPIGGVAFFFALFSVNIPRDPGRVHQPLLQKLKTIDYTGIALLVAAVSCLILALQWGGTSYPWRSSQVIGLLVGSSLLTGAFVWVQCRLGESATIPPRIMRRRSVYVGCAFLFFIQTSSYIKNFFLPFYFQAVQGVSVTTSGVRFIPIAAAQIFGIVATGALVSKIGHFVPFMILGQVIEIIGTYMLSRLDMFTPTAQWASFLALTGLGLGMGQQLPYTAIQIVLNENDVIIGNAVATLFVQLGGAVALSIGETILVNSLLWEVPLHTRAVPGQEVVDVGASHLQDLAPSDAVLLQLRWSYARSVSNTMYFSLGVAGCALAVAFGMEWLNIKKVAEERQKPSSTYASEDGDKEGWLSGSPKDEEAVRLSNISLHGEVCSRTS